MSMFLRARRAGQLLAAFFLGLGIAGTAQAQTPVNQTSLSLLSYNVHGLPWPLAADRPEAMEKIASDLRDMRTQGRQPHVVVLQEAFTSTAKDIFRKAGYRYVVEGPSAAQTSDVAPDAADSRFAAAARWLKGESVGKVYGSGLMILSDYPITSVRKVAYPTFACAGFDCLANKGAMLATVALPDGSQVAVATTHLNSRKASGVANDRSDRAYQRQIEVLDQLLTKGRDVSMPLVVAGDFNVGKSAIRRDFIAEHAALWTGGAAAPVENTLQAPCTLRDATARSTADLDIVKRRSKDWQFFNAGAQLGIRAAALSIPFGHAADGSMLSDHIGYITHYVLDRPKFALDIRARSNSRLA